MRGLIAALLLATSGASAAEYIDQPYLAQIGITPELHDIGDGTGVKIGNLDGYWAWQPDFYGKGAVYNLWNAPATPVRFSTDHSTAVVCTMVCQRNDVDLVGASPGAYVLDYPYWNAADAPIVAHSAWPTAFNHAYNNGARIFNMEVSTITVIGGVTYPTFGSGDLDRIKAQRGRLLFVQPAGNNGLQFGNQNITWRAAGTLDNLLIVGAVDELGAIASYSNTPGERCFYKSGDPVCYEAEKLKNWWVVAPGNLPVLIADGSIQNWQGTSFAGPLVSSAAAIVFDNAARNGVTLGVADVWAILLSTTTDLGDPGVDSVYGRGMVNVAAAIAPVGLTSYPVVPGQIVRDRFRRPYRLDPIPLQLAPTAAAWSFLMGGERFTTLKTDGLAFSTRQAMVDDIAALTMTGVQWKSNGIDMGFSAGTLQESMSALGMVSREPTTTHLAAVDAGVWLGDSLHLSAFYMRGAVQGYAADSYGLGLRARNLSINVVKPLSTFGTPVMALAQWKVRF